MQKLILASLMLAGAATAQMPMPAFNNTFTSTLTRGFFFQAPVAATIQGLEVYNEANQPNQVVEVIDFGTTQPPAWPGTQVGTSLFYDNTSASGTIIPTAIPLIPGNWYAILGACNASQGSNTSYNSYGVSGPFVSSMLGASVTIARAGTQTGLAASGPNQPVWTEAAFNIGRIDVYVGTGSGNFASKMPFGEGCNESYASFYENHSAFDLSGTSLSMTNTGAGYVAIAGANPVVTPTGPATAMGDDVVIPFPLGWTLPYPGGTTTDLYVSSNGFVHLVTNTSSGCCSFNLTNFLSTGPVFAAKWRDLNPSAGGTVTFESDPVAGTATVTFDQVPDFGSATNVNTFQYAFDQSGTVELRFGTCAATSGGTGWSPGAANLDPGSIDLSATPVIITGAVDTVPLELTADARPVIGTSVTLTVDNVPAGTAIGAVIYGLTKHDPGIDLTSIGMPGCFQFTSQDAVALTIAPAGSSFTNLFVVPNDPGLAGVHIQSQGAIFDPAGGHNALGALSTNGIDFGLDVN